MGTADAAEITKFDALLHAVTTQPESVATLLRESPDILEVVNSAAETVLHWLAVENDIEGVRLLHGLGAQIPIYALIHAVEGGHVEMVDLLLGLGAEPWTYKLSRTLDNPIWQFTESQKEALEGCFRKHGKLFMTSGVVQDLMGISSESDLLDRQDEMTVRWLATGADVSDVDAILEFMEQHPAWEFGRPGAFVHFAEKFYRKGYEKRLIDSINRRPAFHTIWMLNRIINGEKDEVRKVTYVALLSEVACRGDVEESVQLLAREFFELHISPQ